MATDLRTALLRFVLEHQHDALVVLDGQGRVLETNEGARRYTPELLMQLVGGLVDVLRRSRDKCTTTASADGRTFRLEGASVDDVLVVSLRELPREVEPARQLAPLGPVTASVIEELNDLLTPILIMSSRLVRELEGSTLGMATVIHTGATLAAALTRDVLALARPRFPFVERVDVNDAVLEMKPLVLRLLGADVGVVFELGDGIGESTLDRRRLEHALLNLIVNARDALSDGGRVTISSALVEEHGRLRIALSVSDDGRGMTDDERLRALDPDPDAVRTGVGIGAVHQFVRDSEGELRVQSAPGAGTTVTMLFDRASVDAQLTSASRSGGGETILVADRDERIRWSMRLVLEAEGYKVLLASTQESALALAATNVFQAAIVDERILAQDPRGFLQRLRALRPQHHIIFMTDAANASSRAAGAVAVLTKAFSGDDLLRVVRRVLDGLSAQAS